MSSCPRVAVVCEGKTDRTVLAAFLDAILGDYDGPDMIQPSVDHRSPSGYEGDSGWKAVREWLRERAGVAAPLATWATVFAADVLIVQVDADVADDADVGCQRPCPPASDTVEALRQTVLEWAGVTKDRAGQRHVPPQVVLWIPSKAVEAWVWAALADKQLRDGLECRPRPASLLVPLKLTRKKGRDYGKDDSAYEARSAEMTANWPRVRKRCPEAARFERELLTALEA